ncbi:MAG TPA: TolC family protein [Bacteroidia bacterium]|nr:TolC family protein [Bacteroidia bacterium]
MKNILLLFSLVLIGFTGYGQTAKTISLEDCYKLARQQYPLIKQRDLIEKTKDYTIQNAAKGYYPQLNINGQATYQSAVTTIAVGGLPAPFNNISFPTVSKDQFNVHGEVDQTIYDGGVIKQQKQADAASANVQEQNVEVQLYALKDRINQIYFGILLIDEQVKQNDLTQKDVQNSIDKMNEGVKNGTATTTNVSELDAELLQQQQNKIQLQASRKAYIDMLGLFINQPLDENTMLQIPVSIAVSDSIKRPELSFYDFQKKNDDAQEKILNSTNRPKFSAFFQGGYAMPGLDAFDVNPAPYYITGFRLSWSLGGYYTLKNQKQILEIDKQNIDVQKETFLFNTNLTLKQQNSDITKLHSMIDKDNDIISKRTEVKDASRIQLENGVITTHEYVSELDAEDQAKQSLLLHQVQLLLAEYSYQNTTGN